MPSFLKFREREQQLFHFLHHAGGQQSAGANQRIPAPIQEPGITGDDRFALVPPDDELFRGAEKLFFKWSAGFRPGVLEFELQRVAGQAEARNSNRSGVCFRRGNQHDVRAFRQRQFKPAGTVSVAAAGLSAALLDRVGNVFAPLRLRMVFASVRKHMQLTIRRRRKGETNAFWISDHSCVFGKMIIRTAIAFGFPMKIPVFDVKSHGQPHIGIGGQLFATRAFGPGRRK